MYKQNLHTHTKYCDGTDTPREMIEEAIRLGFDSLGFSEHSHMEFSSKYGLTKTSEKEYIKEINELKEEYKDKIKIFCGIEYDMYSDYNVSMSEFEYSIGSVHHLHVDGDYLEVDSSLEKTEYIINEYFGGNGLKYAENYFNTLSKLPDYGKFDIIGHFDLVTKFQEKKIVFDENSKEYLSSAFSAAKALQGKIPFFEINTGAISRQCRTSPYPSIPILKELKRLGFGAVLTSDCHNAKMLDCHFNESKEILTECGFNYIYILTEEGFVPVNIAK